MASCTETDHLLATSSGNDHTNDSTGSFATLESDDSVDTYPRNKQPSNALTELKDAWQVTLQETDEADIFLSMGLTKAASVLPSKPEVVQAVEEVEEALAAVPGTPSVSLVPDTVRTPQISTQLVVTAPRTSSKRVPLHAFLTLGSAVCALSSIGPFLAKQQNVSPSLKIVWRFQGTALLLAPFFLRSLWTSGGWPQLTVVQWLTFLAAAASYAVLCVAFAMSVNYITVSDATILTNSQSILLVAVKLCAGQNVLFLEIVGVVVAFMGGILCAKESAEGESSPANGWWSIWGDVLGLVSSMGGIGYIVLGKSLRAHMPVIVFMVLNMLTASFIILFYMWLTGDPFSWGTHIDQGVFGYFHTSQFDRLPLELMTVVICNIMGTMGYVRAFAYFSSVIIAVAALAEPVVASFTAVIMGVGVLPGIEGWVGNILVIVGTMAVLWPTMYPDKYQIKSPAARRPKTPKSFPRLASPAIRARRARALQHCESIDETKAFHAARGSISERV